MSFSKSYTSIEEKRVIGIARIIRNVMRGSRGHLVSFTNNKGTVVSAECKVTVEQIAVTKIALDKESLSLKEDAESKLNVTFEPANATEDLDVKWESDDKNVATVTGEGTFTICIHPSTIL